ncbi:PIN domain-containing protein [Candidatus Poriferisodalis sp.]|uniref:type II toxin-antitoxin system VapC family toxin n=1 Tax=Candidatus Poriferisodalis sp. TaxID=3101277 RepID=UPI003B0139BA
MLLPDSSAWIEFLRGTGTAVALRMRRAIADGEAVVIDPVLLEVVAGARADRLGRTRRLLMSQRTAPLVPRGDWLEAAMIYQAMRRDGITIRSHIDVLIAAAAIRLGLEVLHSDRDFDFIADKTSLRIAPT